MRPTILVPCASRKTKPVPYEASAVSLPVLAQRDLETEWLGRLAAFDRTVLASTFYAGRGMALGRQAAAESGGHLLILSAGLGIVAAEQWIAPYAITVAARGPDAVAYRTRDRFDPAAWWSAIDCGPMAQSLVKIVEIARAAPLLIALSRPYAMMLLSALDAVPAASAANMRLFGWRLEESVPSRLGACVMPYDGRLDAVMPGTRSDYAQRALLHFVRLKKGVFSDAARADAAHVARSLDGVSAPERIARPKVSDIEILDWISARLDTTAGIGRLLAGVRADGIACEQARFSRLYRQAINGRSAA